MTENTIIHVYSTRTEKEDGRIVQTIRYPQDAVEDYKRLILNAAENQRKVFQDFGGEKTLELKIESMEVADPDYI